MSRKPLGWGVVTLAALDVRRRPDHRSELRSQLLLGETVAILARTPDGAWRRVRNQTDGYEGWVRSWGLVAASAVRVLRWRRKARTRVVSLFAEARVSPARGGLVGPLFWNSRVIAGRLRGRHRRVEFPDGRRGWVPAAALAPPGQPPSLHERIQGLLGVPYLWGGRTPAGMDCSGFVQLLLAEQGVPIPRDAEQQYRVCHRVDGIEAARPGDLVFFAPRGGRVAHVGLWLGDGVFVHARGSVRIGSVDRRNPFYENGLAAQVRGVGRLPAARGGRSASGAS